LSTTSNVVETPVNGFQRRLADRAFGEEPGQLGLSISGLARRAGLPYSTVRRIIYGSPVQPPKNEQIEALAKAVGWDPDHTVTDAIRAWFPGVDVQVDESEDVQRLTVLARKLPRERLRALLRAAEAFSENGDG
jgi:transcriptional regulator with XRE-family HTH domain